jgi:RHS repeat-associated protein
VDASGNVIKSYGYRPGSTWTTDPLFMKTGGQYYFYQNDHLGTPQKLTAVNGAVVWSAKYSSFGEADVGPSSTVTNNLRFPGQYFDDETGLHYNYNRYYDPETGRYLRSDPIGIKGGINLFAYSFNNPLTNVDIYGLSSEDIPPTVLVLPNCNDTEYRKCKKSCDSIGRKVRYCKRQDLGSAGVFIYCIPDYRDEVIEKPDRPRPQPGPKKFDLKRCLADAEDQFPCSPFKRALWKIGCFLTAFASGLSDEG